MLLGEAEHFTSNHRAGVLVLARHEIAVDHPMIGKDVGDSGTGFVQCALPAKFGLRMLRRTGNPKVTHLAIADSGDMPALDQRPSVRVSGVDQPERAVAHSTDDLVGRACFGDLVG